MRDVKSCHSAVKGATRIVLLSPVNDYYLCSDRALQQSLEDETRNRTFPRIVMNQNSEKELCIIIMKY